MPNILILTPNGAEVGQEELDIFQQACCFGGWKSNMDCWGAVAVVYVLQKAVL